MTLTSAARTSQRCNVCFSVCLLLSSPLCSSCAATPLRLCICDRFAHTLSSQCFLAHTHLACLFHSHLSPAIAAPSFPSARALVKVRFSSGEGSPFVFVKSSFTGGLIPPRAALFAAGKRWLNYSQRAQARTQTQRRAQWAKREGFFFSPIYISSRRSSAPRAEKLVSRLEALGHIHKASKYESVLFCPRAPRLKIWRWSAHSRATMMRKG